MNPQRILGIALLVVGVVLLIIGMNASHPTVDQLGNTLTGRFTDHTTWYIVGGIGVVVLGLVLMLPGLGGKKT